MFRELLSRYKQAFFGVAWAVIQPLLTVTLLSFVFGRLVGFTAGDVPYPVFVFAGLLLWAISPRRSPPRPDA